MTFNKNFAFILLALLLNGCGTTSGPRIDNIPMYGQPEKPRPEFMKRFDEAFIKAATSLFNGNREAASKGWATEADRFFKGGDLDYAMRRYNQAWLLDDKNYLPYWGFGQVMMIQEKIDGAVEFYEKAMSLIDDEYQKPALFTDLGLAYSFKARSLSGDDNARVDYFRRANQYFEEASALDNNYPTVWRAWADSLFHENKYAEAWNKVKKSRELGHTVQPKFLDRLRNAMPEPQ